MSSKNTDISIGGRKNTRYCSYCNREVTFQLHIKCAECENFILCGDCFSIGAYLSPHKPWHPYQVVECLEYPCFVPEWSYAEELLLLEAIEKCGLGNWKVVAEYMAGTHGLSGVKKGEGGEGALSARELKEKKELLSQISSYGRGAKEVETHYWDLYVRSGFAANEVSAPEQEQSIDEGPRAEVIAAKSISCPCYLPEKHCVTAVGTAAVAATVQTGELHYTAAKPVPTANEAAGTDTSAICGCILAQTLPAPRATLFPGTSCRPPHPLNAPEVTTAVLKDNSSINKDTLLPGYMPLRCDFDVEYDNDAEILLSEMEFANDISVELTDPQRPVGVGNLSFASKYEHPSEIQLKLQVVDIFNQKLTQREQRKHFVVSSGLVDIKRQQQLERKAGSGVALLGNGEEVEERELVSKLRMFSRFSQGRGTETGFDRATGAGASEEVSSPAGTSTTASASASATASGSSLRPRIATDFSNASTSHGMLIDALLKVKKLRRQIEVLRHYRRLGVSGIDDPKLGELEKKRKAQKDSGLELVESEGPAAKRASLGGEAQSQGRKSRASGSGTATFESLPMKRTNSRSSLGSAGGSSGSLSKLSNNNHNNTSTTSASVPIPRHISRDPAYSSLSSAEQQLCAAVDILPGQYQALQAAFSREATRSGLFAPSGTGAGNKELQRMISSFDETKKQTLADFFIMNEK